MRCAKLYRYQLTIRSGLILRQQSLSQRQGFLLHLSENEQHGWGEIAPLPSFSLESLDIAEQQLRTWINDWLHRQSYNIENLVPSVAFGISIALAELHQQLGEAANYQTAFLFDSDSSFIPSTSNVIAKMKVGRGEPIKEGQTVNHLLAKSPLLKLRLDANRAWSAKSAARFAEQIQPIYRPQIAFIEEPCSTPSLSQQFAEQFNINIAWDETVQETSFLFPRTPKLAAIIIKPTLLGSLEKCKMLITQAKQQNIMPIISSSLESSLALTQLARLAQQYTPESPPGLDTLGLMHHQLLRRWPHSSLPLIDVQSPFVSEVSLDESGI